MKLKVMAVASAMCMSVAGLGCVPNGGGGGGGGGGGTGQTGPTMDNFSSDQEFDEYMADLLADQPEPGGGGGDDFAEDGDASAGDAPSAPPENDEITNNQEEGVDEGGIVKNVGDYLVVLRQGALYSVDVSESGETAQADSIRVAPVDELNQSVWYDEMLVRGNQIYVIGYRYIANVLGDNDDEYLNWIFGATEVTSFSLSDDGEFSRGESTFIESNDYYSGSNYASRLVDGKIVFYMPYYAFVRDGDQTLPRIPRLLTHHEDQTFRSQAPLFSPTDVVRPNTPPEHPTFHTVVQCELPDDLSIDCGATSLLAEFSREFYVSRDLVYLWTPGFVFALSQQDGSAQVHAAHGSPSNQFSFREKDKTLYVGVTRYVEADNGEDEDGEDGEDGVGTEPVEIDGDDDGFVGDGDWGGGGSSNMVLELLALPLRDFDAVGEQELDDKIQHIADINGYGWNDPNRHVGEWYLYGDGQDLLAHRLDGNTTETFSLDGRISRIESTPGIGALVVSNDGADLVLDSLLLGDDAELTAGTTLEGMREGESRSHGFFFRPDADGGLFGLPVLNTGSGGGWWGSGISNVAFFRADTSGAVDFRGTVSSSDEAGGVCETSCVDWYGNTRPIFLRDRIYALMGSEVAEVDVAEEVTPVGDSVILTRD